MKSWIIFGALLAALAVLLGAFGAHGLKGKIKIISVVPQLNTPVCDKQTHAFSESNGGLDKDVDIITLSTNTIKEQNLFAKKANIHNLVFLLLSWSHMLVLKPWIICLH